MTTESAIFPVNIRKRHLSRERISIPLGAITVTSSSWAAWVSDDALSISMGIMLESQLDPSTNSLSTLDIFGGIRNVALAWGSSWSVVGCAHHTWRSFWIVQTFLHQASCLSKPCAFRWILQWRHFRWSLSTWTFTDFFRYVGRRAIGKAKCTWNWHGRVIFIYSLFVCFILFSCLFYSSTSCWIPWHARPLALSVPPFPLTANTASLAMDLTWRSSAFIRKNPICWSENISSNMSK